MDDIGTLCLIGIIVIAGLMLLPRLLGGGMGRGPIRPTYDDPDIEGSGSFGPSRGVGSERPTYDDPNIGGRGSFGRSRSGGPTRIFRRSSPGGGASPRANSPRIRGRGSFGRSKN